MCEPSVDSLTLMASIFDVSLDYLLVGKETETHDKTVEHKPFTKADIVFLVMFLISVLAFIDLLIYSILNPIYYNQTESFIWWYVRFWVSSGTLFRVFVLLSLAGMITFLILFLKKRKRD